MSFWKKILTTIRSLLGKLPNEEFVTYYNKIAKCQDFAEFIQINAAVGELAVAKKFDIRDEILLKQALRIKNYEFMILQMQNEINMLSLSTLLTIDKDAMNPYSTNNIEAKRTKEYEKVEDGEICSIKDLWKRQ